MPIYEFDCQACNQTFEELVRSQRDEKGVQCPECGSRRVQRRLSRFATHAAPATSPLPRGGCGRCGDPAGPCGLE